MNDSSEEDSRVASKMGRFDEENFLKALEGDGVKQFPPAKPLNKYLVSKFGETCVTIEALYYNLEGGFFVFKDNAHATVYTVNSTTVSDIIRQDQKK